MELLGSVQSVSIASATAVIRLLPGKILTALRVLGYCGGYTRF